MKMIRPGGSTQHASPHQPLGRRHVQFREVRAHRVGLAVTLSAEDQCLHDTGHARDGFSFDHEIPRHPAWLHPHESADRLVSCGDDAQFIADGGYQRPELWSADGWAAVRAQQWQAPAYWLAPDDHRLAYQCGTVGWQVYGVHGIRPMEPEAPVMQESFYAAAAYAEWAGACLPTEFEWEAAYAQQVIFRNSVELTQMTGHVWHSTRSSYDPCPGF